MTEFLGGSSRHTRSAIYPSMLRILSIPGVRRHQPATCLPLIGQCIRAASCADCRWREEAAAQWQMEEEWSHQMEEGWRRWRGHCPLPLSGVSQYISGAMPRYCSYPDCLGCCYNWENCPLVTIGGSYMYVAAGYVCSTAGLCVTQRVCLCPSQGLGLWLPEHSMYSCVKKKILQK